MLSNAEQHACLQQVYHYVYNNDNYNDIEIDEYNVKKLSKIDVLEAGINVVNGYIKKDYYDIDIILDALFNLGLLLKKNFKWKYPKLNKSYIEEVKNHKIFDQSIVFVDMVKYIIELQHKYQRKVYRAIYKAINDRKEK